MSVIEGRVTVASWASDGVLVTNTPADFDSAPTESGATFWSAGAPSKIEPSVAARYTFVVAGEFLSGTTGFRRISIIQRDSGATIKVNQRLTIEIPDPSGTHYFNERIELDIASGDYVEIFPSNGTGAGVNVDIDVYIFNDPTYQTVTSPVVPTTGSGLQIHPYNLFRDPNTTLTATTAAAGYSVTSLRDTRTSRKLRSTTTTLIIDAVSTSVNAGYRHADCFILPPGHNLLPGDTILIEAHNGGAAIFTQTKTLPENPDTDPSIWGEAGITLATYGCLFFPFGEDALASATQWRITITTQAPNTYVEIPPPYFGWSLEMDRNYFYGWGDSFAGLPLAAADQVRHVLNLTFGAATDNDWRKAALINRELGTAMPFYISLEPSASTAATTKDGLRQHRLTFYGYLASMIDVDNRFLNLNTFTINFRAQK